MEENKTIPTTEMFSFEFFTPEFTQIVQGRSVDNALNIFRLFNPTVEISAVLEIKVKEKFFNRSYTKEDLKYVYDKASLNQNHNYKRTFENVFEMLNQKNAINP